MWEAFVDGIRDVHATKVPTIVEFDFQVLLVDSMLVQVFSPGRCGRHGPTPSLRSLVQISSEEKDHAAACFIQRTWRAWKEQNTYLKLQVSVAIIKTRMLQMAAKRILAELDRTSDDSSSAHKRIINALRDVMRDASFHLAYLKTDPTGMLKSARAIESAKRIRREHKAALQIEMLAPGATSVRSRRAAISQRRFSLKTRHVSEPPGTSIREGAKDQANPLDQPDTLRGGKRRQRPQLILTQNPQEGTSSMAEARGMTSFQVKNTLSSGGLADERSMWEQARWRLGVTSLTVASITALLYEDD